MDKAAECARLAGSTRIHEVSHHVWRIRDAAPTDSLAEFCESKRIDHAFIPGGRRFADLKLDRPGVGYTLRADASGLARTVSHAFNEAP